MLRARRLGSYKAKADRASVLDGSTLRVSGRVRPVFAFTSEAALLELWLRPRGGRARRLCAADARRSGGAGLGFAASVSLVDQGGRSLIGPGTWDVYVRVPGKHLLAVRAPEFEKDRGPTLANPRSPQTGLWYRLRCSKSGQLAIQVKAFPPHAEVEQIREEPTALVVVGRIVGTAAPSTPDGPTGIPARLEFIDRGTGRVQSVPARVHARHFEAEANPQLFTVGDGEFHLWEMALRVPGSEPMPVGRFLDDIRKPESSYRYPDVVVGSGSGQATAVQPVYTGERRLALHCGPAVGEGSPS